MKMHLRPSLALPLVPLLFSMLPATAGFVVNPSFEFNYNATWPHYVDSGGQFIPLDAWTGASGLNDSTGPFHNTGTPVPDQTYVGFKQGSGAVAQGISGLDPSKRYWVQYFYDARTGSLFDLAVTWDGETIDSVTAVRPSANRQYRFRNAAFQPVGDTGNLEFRTAVTGDSTLLLDAVCLVQRDEGEVVLQNPGFEASGDVADSGNVTQLAGWAVAGSVGVNNPSGPFANNGTIPEQDHAVFLQQASRISQTVRGLIPNNNYTVTFRCNAPTGKTPHLVAMAGEHVLYDQTITPVGGAAAYRTVTASFTALADTVELSFEQTVSDGDQTVLLDDIHMLGTALAPLPDLVVGPAAIELAPNAATGEISVTVSRERLERGPCVIVLRSGNPGVADFVNVEEDGLLRLSFPAGNDTTTLTAEVQGFARGQSTIVVEENGGHDAVQGTMAIEVVSSFVRNPSFEASPPKGDAGYGPIAAWTQVGGSGPNSAAFPFVAGTTIPDREQAAFVQGSGALTQQIYGLTKGKTYRLQFHYNARNCCGGIPSLVASIDGMEVANIPEIAHQTDFHFHEAEFVLGPDAPDAVELAFRFAVPTGDGSALLDAVNIVERPSTDVTVINPSFEGTSISAWPGYLGRIAGWNTQGGHGTNVDERGPFSDNGIAAAQDRVLFLQNTSSASQTITGLTVGSKYTLSFLLNARNAQPGITPSVPYQIAINGVSVEDGVQDPVGVGSPYTQKSIDFTAEVEEALIEFKCVPEGGADQTLLIDEVRVFPAGAPAGVALTATPLAGNSVVLKWPASSDPTLVLMSSTTMAAGSWTNVSTPPDVIGGFNTVVEAYSGTRKFYALFKP